MDTHDQWEPVEIYDGFDRLDEAIKRRERLRQAKPTTRMFSGYERKVRILGRKNDIDKYWEKKLFAYRKEINDFYKAHPELGNAKEYDE